MPLVTKGKENARILFSEKEVQALRTSPFLKGDHHTLPENHWVQVTLSPSGILVGVYPEVSRGFAFTMLVERARKAMKR